MKSAVLPFAIPFENPVFRIFCFATRRQIHCPMKYATPKELNLSFNLVSLYEAISLRVNDKMKNTEYGIFKWTVVFFSVRTCGRRSREHRIVSWSFFLPCKLFIVSAGGHLSSLCGIKNHTIFGRTLDEHGQEPIRERSM